MANYTKLNAGTENRTELHDVPGLTSAEVSINRLPAGAGKAEIGELRRIVQIGRASCRERV